MAASASRRSGQMIPPVVSSLQTRSHLIIPFSHNWYMILCTCKIKSYVYTYICCGVLGCRHSVLMLQSCLSLLSCMIYTYTLYPLITDADYIRLVVLCFTAACNPASHYCFRFARFTTHITLTYQYYVSHLLVCFTTCSLLTFGSL